MLIPDVESLTLNWHPLVLLVVLIFAGSVFGFATHCLFAWGSGRPWVRKYLHHEHHEIANHFIGVVGVIYAVLIGFLVVTAWAGRDHAIQLTIQEQRSVDDLFHLMTAYPGETATTIRWS
jgi:hypothetical protein